MSAEKNIYLGEEDFKSRIKKEAEPFLKQYEKHGYLTSYDDTQIFYRMYVLPISKAGIVISHGFCEFAEKYTEVIYYFLKNGYSVYVPEHRGHGYSDRKTTDAEKVHVKSYEEYVQDLHFFIKKIVEPREDQKLLFAHSMGGAIAARYLEEYPLVFDGAVLSSPMLMMNTGKYPVWVAKLTADFYHLIHKGTHYAAGQHGFETEPSYETSSCVSRERYFYVYEKRLKNMQYQTYGGTYDWVRAGMKAVKEINKPINLEQIRTPILLFSAGHDHMVDNRAIEHFARQVKKVTYLQMEESKHEIFNAGDAVRENYYRKIFTFMDEQAMEAQQKKIKEVNYETENEQTGKVLGII